MCWLQIKQAGIQWKQGLALGCTVTRWAVTKGAPSPQSKSHCWVRTSPSAGRPQGACLHQRIFVQPRIQEAKSQSWRPRPEHNCVTSCCPFSMASFRHCCRPCVTPGSRELSGLFAHFSSPESRPCLFQAIKSVRSRLAALVREKTRNVVKKRKFGPKACGSAIYKASKCMSESLGDERFPAKLSVSDR